MRQQILLMQFLFLATGVVFTLVTQWLKYRGAANSLSFLTPLCQFLGMALVAVLPPPRQIAVAVGSSQSVAAAPSAKPILWAIPVLARDHLARFGQVHYRGAILISVLEVVGNLILVAGMFLTGSGLYMVIYSSVVVFTALFSHVLLPGRKLNKMQWASVIAICFGLSFTAFGSKSSDASASGTFLLGILICLGGTAIIALVYVGTDHLLSTEASTPYAQSIYVGIFSSLFNLITMALFSIPTLRSLPLFDWDVILAHAILILSYLGHSVAYFELVESTGGVATGVLQGLRAVGVFGLSHAWFCGTDEAQCFNIYKGVATIVVVSGVVAFSAAKKGHTHKKPVRRVVVVGGNGGGLDLEGEEDGDNDSQNVLLENMG